MNKVINIYNF